MSTCLPVQARMLALISWLGKPTALTACIATGLISLLLNSPLQCPVNGFLKLAVNQYHSMITSHSKLSYHCCPTSVACSDSPHNAGASPMKFTVSLPFYLYVSIHSTEQIVSQDGGHQTGSRAGNGVSLPECHSYHFCSCNCCYCHWVWPLGSMAQPTTCSSVFN